MVQRINLEHLNFKLKKAEEYLISIGLEPICVGFYGTRQDNFMDAIAVVDKNQYNEIASRLYTRGNNYIQYAAHFIINCDTGEWIKERYPLPITKAEEVLYGE